MNKTDDELIWVVPLASTNDALYGDPAVFTEPDPGVFWSSAPLAPHALPWMGELFMVRAAAERDERFLQPIPYVVLVQGGRFVRFRRLLRADGGGEERLAGRTSIGVGGHLSAIALEWLPQECRPGGQTVTQRRINEETWRELNEEFLFVDALTGRPRPLRDCPLEFRGYLLDRRDAVGRVHLGLVYVLDLPDDVRVDVHADERHKLRLEAPLAPGQAAPDLEGWSRLVVDHALVGLP